MKPAAKFSPFRLLVTFAVIALLFLIGWQRLTIDTDIIDYLPHRDRAVSDAVEMFKNHPIQDQLIIDVGLPTADPDRLVLCGQALEKRLVASGMFKQVGLQDFERLWPELVTNVAEHLPLLFNAAELEASVAPLLSREAVRQRLVEIRAALMNLEGIGQARLIEKDPLALSRVVMAKLAPLAPSPHMRFYKGQLISPDRRHLLIVARPRFSGTDTRFARRLAELIEDAGRELNRRKAPAQDPVTLTPVGAYRAALDNELTVRKDVTRVVLLATVGIALLLIFAFPRPYIGLLSLLPAIAGTAGAFFIFSLLHESISIMVVGFGGAIISITVDHGIAYLLFLDRPRRTFGRDASREVWSVGLLAVLTTVGAFGVLCLSGFPIFEQLGLFAALGISLSFVFVHTVFPLIFPAMPAGPDRHLPLQSLADRLARSGKIGLVAALVFMHGMMFWAKPSFNVDLAAMNTVSAATLAAEKTAADVWGQVLNKVHLMIRGDSLEQLQQKGDELLTAVEAGIRSGSLSSGFVPAMVFPGEVRSRRNLSDWQAFWRPDRIAALRQALAAAAGETGFAEDAFTPFFRQLTPGGKSAADVGIPPAFFHLLGISQSADGRGWIQVSSLATGTSYDAERFYAAHRSLGRIFEPTLFSQRLGKLLFSTFFKMLIIVGTSIAVMLFVFYLDLRLTVVTLVPVGFALVSTLGTLNLIGHPLDIAGLMLAIIVFGMGIDYSIFFVRSYQRYADLSRASFGLIRMAVFMAAASTLIGFGALCTADHNILRSAGLTAVFGIGYSLIGALVLLPPILPRLLKKRPADARRYQTPAAFVIGRYRNLEAYHRLFARFKMRLDPMFRELAALLPAGRPVRTLLDIGCGYGVPACWLLWHYPDANLTGFDPDPERVRVASMALGARGVVIVARAPDLPPLAEPPDLAVMLDIVHFLNDEELQLTFQKVYDELDRGACFIVRATVPPPGRPSWTWTIENLKIRSAGLRGHFRPADRITGCLGRAGFGNIRTTPSGNRGELAWFVAHKT